MALGGLASWLVCVSLWVVIMMYIYCFEHGCGFEHGCCERGCVEHG